MSKVSVDDFLNQVDCVYDSERYSVRDNGAVMRHTQPGKKPRPTDNEWTFGKLNVQSGYLSISQARINRIVATAFHGESPTPQHIADHIDTNRQNNRPENLRWLTKLENVLLNPITRKKVEYICGSIEAFLEDPSILQHAKLDRSLEWMRTVNPEEARNCKMRLTIWAKSDRKPVEIIKSTDQATSFKERIYKPLRKWEVGLGREPGLEMALTPWCAQYMWKADAYFPSCPNRFGVDPIQDYLLNLRNGEILAYGEETDACPRLTIIEAVLLREKTSILIMCKSADDIWFIVGIELHQKSNHFIHFIIGKFSDQGEAYKQFSSKNTQTNFWSEGYANGN